MIKKCKNESRSEYRFSGGFTLVELLIVIAIIGVLAAIIVPNVTGLIGSGDEEAAAAEFSLVQSAMDTMMAKKGLRSVTATAATNDMGAFPSGNPLYPDYLRSSTTRAEYSCTASGLVLSAAGSTPFPPATATALPTTPAATTTTAPPATTTTAPPATTTTMPPAITTTGPPATTTTVPPATTTSLYPAWAPDTAYRPQTYVTYNGAVFYARYYANENERPGEISSPWQEVTDQWRDFNVYQGGDTVTYGGAQFEARHWSQNEAPGLISSPWQEVTDQWRDFNIYKRGDVVWYNGTQYRAAYHSQNVTPGTSDAWVPVD